MQLLVSSLPAAVAIAGGGERARLNVGLHLREVKEVWTTSLALACAVEGLSAADFSAAVGAVKELDLADCWRRPPLLSGSEVKVRGARDGEKKDKGRVREARVRSSHITHSSQAALGLGKGPEIGEWLGWVVRWELENRGGGAAECEAAMRRERELRQGGGAGGGKGGP